MFDQQAPVETVAIKPFTTGINLARGKLECLSTPAKHMRVMQT
jgi:hypothetical protein